MKAKLFVLLSLLVLSFSGCSDCESDYDAVGVTVDDFAARTGIVSTLSNQCSATHQNADCIAQTNNKSAKYLFNQGFVVQCGTEYKFDLQQTIQAYYPAEKYKEKDDPFEKCYDYWVYDFFSTVHKSQIPLEINSIQVDNASSNLWYVSVGGTCYQWDVSASNYAVTK